MSSRGHNRPPKTILFLDLATRFGWCQGAPGEEPRYGSQRFAPEGAEGPAVFGGAIKWMGERLQSNRPSVVFYEEPLDPRHLKKTTKNTTMRLMGIPAIIEGVCYCYSFFDIRSARIDDIRYHLLQRKPPRATAKQEVIARLRALGFAPQDDNAADAIAGWLFACSIVEPGVAAMSTPLFGDRYSGGRF